MKVYLVNETNRHEDAGNEYTTETTVAVFTDRGKAEELASRGGWDVEEMDCDLTYQDSWQCQIAFNGDEVGCTGPSPVLKLPETSPDPWMTGCVAYGWSPEEARQKAQQCYDEKVGPGYRKLTVEIEKRKKKLGIP